MAVAVAVADDENGMKKTVAVAVGEDDDGGRCPLLEPSPPGTQRAGGFTTLPFIAGNLALTQMVNCGISPNMILYLMREYGLSMTTGSNVIYWWGAFTNVTPILAALMADSFMGRFHMISLGSLINLFGITLLWLTAVMPQARPPQCTQSNNNNICTPATPLQLLVLLVSLVLVSVGSGGVRSSSLAFGIDQLKSVEKVGGAMESYFGCYYAINMASLIVSITCLVYIQENLGWEVGFGVLVVLMLFATACILLGYPFYVKPKPKGSLITGLFQVVVAWYRRRSITIPSRDDKGVVEAYHQQGPTLRHPSETLRFLNKACIIQDPQKDLNSDGKAINPWNLCTLEQVEELKACLKVLPIWATGVIMNINVSQGSFNILQATTMDRHVGPSTGGFEIPAASLSIFTYASIIAWLALYERVIRRRFRFTTMARMGCGIFVSLLAVAAAAVVEGTRRARAASEGLSDDPEGIVGMSVLWVVPQAVLTGLAEGMNAVAQNEFYVSEFPPSMWSIASNFLGVGAAAASMAASGLMSALAGATRGWDEGSWISSNINKGHYDYYNWVLVGLSLINIMLFILCSKAYGPYGEDKKNKESYVVED